jgi:hypothetical protein
LQLGVSDETAGGIGFAAVVNVHPVLPAAFTPRALFAAVLIVMLKSVLNARLVVGVNVATMVAALYVTAPGTGVVPGPATVKVVALMVAGSIASLKVAVTVLLVATPAEPQMGMVAVTVGAGNLQPVQSEHAARKSAIGTIASNHNTLVLKEYLLMACDLRALVAHKVAV